MTKFPRSAWAITFFSLALTLIPFRALAFDLRNHSYITTSSLKFLKPNIYAAIEYSNLDVDSSNGGWNHDTRTSHAWHFDNCLFEQATYDINSAYQNLLSLLNPDDPGRAFNVIQATYWFGRVLHPAQDFYAHSNWVELGKTELLDDGLNMWPVLTPLSMVKGVKIVQGEHFESPYLPEDISLSLESSYRVRVDGLYPGLVSGMSGFWLTDDDCPDEVTISHDNLNKDSSKRPNHLEARYLAKQQTIHEWCRLLVLVNERYGAAGIEFLFEQWVADRNTAFTICLNEQLISFTPPNPVSYEVTIKTGNVDKAGGDEWNAYLMLQGAKDDSAIISLSTPKVDNLEKGAVDHYVAHSYPSDLGEIVSVKVWYDSSEGWFLESATIRNPQTNQIWSFSCSKWLDSNSEGSYTQRTLYPDHCD